MTYYDQTFEPYKIVDGKCVVADEAEWENLRQIDLVECLNPDGGHRWDCEGRGEDFCPDCGWPEADTVRPIVKVPDIFEDVEGPVVDRDGKTPYVSLVRGDATEMRAPIGCRDIVNRLFQVIDSTPHVDYLIVTQRPELVREKWQRLTTGSGHNPSPHEFHRANVTLATYVETQNDIERLVPELLKCHDICKGLEVICNPREELDFRKFFSGLECDFCGPVVSRTEFDGQCNVTVCPSCFTCFDDAGSTVTGTEAVISRIIVEGNEHPIHPQWLRSLRDQCKDVVPFNFAGWGRWLPRGQGKSPKDRAPFLARQGSFDVGPERSGRLLDGQEHNGRIK